MKKSLAFQILASILAAVMIVGFIPLSNIAGLVFPGFLVDSSAANIVSSGTCGENLTWELDDKGTLTISGEGKMSASPFRDNQSIRSVIFGYGVTSIVASAFFDCWHISSVTISDSVTSIGGGAFKNCSGLSSVIIPASVSSIGIYAFQFCGLSFVSVLNPTCVINDDGGRTFDAPKIYGYAGSTAESFAKRNGKNFVDLATVDHTWNTGVITTLATCTMPGVKTFTCITCNASKTETINAIGHNYGAWTNLNETQHQRVCANNANHTQTEDHTWNEGEITVAVSCVNNGEITFTCTSCGATRTETINAIGHSYGAWTRLNDAQHQRVCANNNSHKETADHTWDEGVITTVATCTENGVKTYACTVCNATRTETIPATGHSYGTWTKLNDTQHQCICANDNSHKETATHTWDDGVITTAATCTMTGVETFTCTTCNATKTETINATGHKDEDKNGVCDVCETVLVATPAVPTGVTATATGNKAITVSWSAVADATQYDVYRYKGTAYQYIGTTFADAANPTEYVDTGLTVGTDYYYKVVAVYKDEELTLQRGKSAFAHTVALGKTAAPANVAVTPTAEKQLTVTWSAVKGATQYNVYRYNGKEYKYIGTTFASAAKPTQYVDSGLTVGTDYYYKVVSVVKGSGLTFTSDKSTFAHTVALGTPAVPTNVAVTPTAEKELTVTWSAVKGATQYNVYRYNGTAYKYIGTTLATAEQPTQYVDGDLTVGTDYYYKVVSVCKGSGLTFVSDKSAFAHTVALGTPGVPQNVKTAATGSKEITVSWSAVKGATQYNVYRYNGSAYKYIGTTFASAAKPTQYVDGDRTVGIDYYYKVVAVVKGNSLTFQSNKSAFAHTVALDALTAPDVPQGLTALAAGSKTIVLYWAESEGATQYNVYRSTSANGTYQYVGTSYSTDYVSGDLTTGVTYYYKLTAVNKTADYTLVSEKSAAVSATAK